MICNNVFDNGSSGRTGSSYDYFFVIDADYQIFELLSLFTINGKPFFQGPVRVGIEMDEYQFSGVALPGNGDGILWIQMGPECIDLTRFQGALC